MNKNPTEAQINYIMAPLKAAEFKAKWRVCSQCQGAKIVRIGERQVEQCNACDGTGYVPQYEPDDGSEEGL